MTLKTIAIAGVFAATTILPLSAASQTRNTCTSGEPTPASHTRNLAQEGATLIQAIQVDAYKITNHADTLVSFQDYPERTWESHAAELSAVRDRVNDIGKKLYRLEVIRHSLPEWQQKAIARMRPAAIELADSTTAALNYLNAHQGQLISPSYTEYTKDVYAKASRLSTSLKDFEIYAKANSEEAHLQRTLGLKKSD